MVQAAGLRNMQPGAHPVALPVLLALLAGCSHGDADGPEGGLAQAPVQVEPMVYDFGQIPFGQMREGVYRITNRSGRELELVQAGPAPCDCASLELEFPDRPEDQRRVRVDPNGMQLPVHAGESFALHLVLNTARYREPVSRKFGAFVLRFAGYDGLRLEFEADIWNPHWVEPWALDLGSVGVRQRASGSVVVHGHDASQFELIAPDEVDGWALQVDKMNSGDGIDTYRVTVTAPPELPQGGFQQDFVLHSNLKDAPPIRFSVQGVAEPDIAWAPKRVLFTAGERPRTVDLVLRALPGDMKLPRPAVAVEGQGADAITAAVEELEPEHAWRVRLSCGAPEPAVTQTGTVRVATGVPEQPEIAVPYSILPPRGGQKP